MRPLAILLACAAALCAQDMPHEPGCDVRLYQLAGDLAKLPELVAGQTPNKNWLAKRIDLDEDAGDFKGLTERYYTTITARLNVPRAGTYRFRLTSDDGSALSLDGKVVIDNDGLHGFDAKERDVALEKRGYALLVRHFENGGGSGVRLEWRAPGEAEFSVVGVPHLTTPKGVVRVTAPGVKRHAVKRNLNPYGDRRPLVHVHPSYDLATIRPKGFQPRVGGLDFLPDGRLVVCCWEPAGGVYIVDADHAKRIAHGLAEPLGLKVVGERLFVLQKQELTELIDHDGDEVIDEYRCVADGWSVTDNFHEFAFGLVEKDGWLYFNLAIAIDPGGASTSPQAPDRGRTARVEIATGRLEYLTHGLRTPNGIGRGVGGEIFITDNQGDWLPVSKLLHLKKGAFYNGRAALPHGFKEPPVTPPVAWLPQNEIGNSPSEPGLLTGGPFDGHMVHGDVTHGGLKRVFVEKIGDVYQGCVFRFTQGLEAGINRLKTRPGGAIVVGGVGSSGNWQQEGKRWYGLQALTPNEDKSFEMRTVEARRNGFLITMTEPFEGGLDGLEVQRWRYVPTKEYGGPKVDEQTLAARVSTNGLRILVEVEMTAGWVYYVRLPSGLRSVEERCLWSTEAWYTLNAVPDRAAEPYPAFRGPGAPTREPLDWTPLGPDAWRGFKAAAMPAKGWTWKDGVLTHAAKGGGGDLVTKEQYDDFEFRCEWMIAAGGNSGIMYLVSEDAKATYFTGPEMQVLDNGAHADGGGKLTSAGALYGLIACRRPAVRPPGHWNLARIRVQGGKVEHWLNGVKVVSADLHSAAFQALVAKSKFKDMPGFARNRKGHIALQDHGDEVRYRDLKIRTLK